LPAWLAWAVKVGAMVPGASAAAVAVAEASANSAATAIDPAKCIFMVVVLVRGSWSAGGGT